jgi:hypothetical protein
MIESLQHRIHRVLSDPASSYWLKDALATALKRDPIDAERDADVLNQLLRERADEALRL